MKKYETNISLYEYDNGVLKNKFNIQKQVELEELERKIVSINTMSYNGTTNSYDLKYLCHIHKYLFSDIFDWAGELRKVDISKGSTKFANFQYIESSWNDYVSNKIKNLNNSNDKIYTLAEILSEINIIHPFREGNGRVVRIFITQLAKTVGINLNWNLVTEEENLNASILSIANPEPMARLLKKCII